MGARQRALCAALLALALAQTGAAEAAAQQQTTNGRAQTKQNPSSIACSASQPCPNPNWACCAGKCLSPARGLACVGKKPCPAAAVCGGGGNGGLWGGASSSQLTCCTADAGVCVAGGTRCCPRDRVCGDACCGQGEACGVDGNGAARCRSALPRPLQAGGRGDKNNKQTAILSARESGAVPLVFDDQQQQQQNAAAERRWRSAGFQEDPCGRATAVLTATRLVGGARLGSDGAAATVRTCCELCATTVGCGHFSFDGDSGSCVLKAGGAPTVAKRLASASGPVVASSRDADNDGKQLRFSSRSDETATAAGLLWAVPSRAFVSGTLAYAPSPELCPQSRLCSAAGSGDGNGNNAAAAAACCPGPVGPGKPWTCSPQGMCVSAVAPAPPLAAGPQTPRQQQQQQVAAALLVDQQDVLSKQPAGSVVNYAAAARAAAAFLVQDPTDPQACVARAEAATAAGQASPFAFRGDTMIAPRSGGALNRDRPTVAATAAACCFQCAGISNCAHFSWDSQLLACSLYSDRAGADGAARAQRLEVSKRGAVAGSMIPRLALASADGGASAAAADAAAARCASPCGSDGLCCSGSEACLEPTGLPGVGGAEHSCCARDNVCGKRCGCDAGDTCVAGQCCPASRACGGKCCAPSDRCSADGACVRNGGGGGNRDSSAFRVITGTGSGGPYNRGFTTNWGSEYLATPLSSSGKRR